MPAPPWDEDPDAHTVTFWSRRDPKSEQVQRAAVIQAWGVAARYFEVRMVTNVGTFPSVAGGREGVSDVALH